jgi:hypothetical protein
MIRSNLSTGERVREPDDRDLEGLAGEIKEFAKMGLLRKSVAAQAAVLGKCPQLRELPATRRAGTTKATPRFEYLVQAIVDAIDAIELRGHDADAEVLRALFGLTEQVRRSGWAHRQDTAAALYGVGRDQFRRNIQPALLTAVAEALVSNGVAIGLDEGEQSLRAAPQQDGLLDHAVRLIERERPREAHLLELSTATIEPILEALRDADVDTKLLVANPYKSTSTWQQERSSMTLVDRYQGIFSTHPRLEVRMYSVPPSLRGRLVGDHIQLGWYTYRDDIRHDSESPDAALIWGHDNAMVYGSASSPHGSVLAGWFRREFWRLWRHRLTRRGPEVLRTLGLEPDAGPETPGGHRGSGSRSAHPVRRPVGDGSSSGR